MKNSNSQLKAGVLISYITLIISNIIPLFYTPFVIRTLGMEEFGIYSLAKSVTFYLVLLNLGMGAGVVKFVNNAIASNDEKAKNNVFSLFVYAYGIIFFCVLLTGFVIAINAGSIFKAIPESFQSTLKILILIVTLSTAFSLFFSVFVSVIQAHQKFVFEKTIGLLSTFITPALIIISLMAGYRSIAIVCATGLISILYGIVSAFYVHKILHLKLIFRKIDKTPLKSIFHFTKFIFLGEIANILFSSTDRVILGMFVSASAIAIYSVGLTFDAYFESVVTTISHILFPKVNEMVTKNFSLLELENLLIKVGRLQYIILGFILCSFIVFGDRFIFLWIGNGYEYSYWIALVVMIPVSVPLLQSVALSIIRAMSKHDFRAKVFVFVAIVNVVGSVLVVKKWGALGCASVTSIAYLIGPVGIMNWFYHKRIGLDMIRFWKNIIKMSTAFVVMLILGMILKYQVPLNTWRSFFFATMCFSVLYFVIMWYKGMNKYEKELVTKLVKKEVI